SASFIAAANGGIWLVYFGRLAGSTCAGPCRVARISVAASPLTTALPINDGCIPATPLPSGMWHAAHICWYSFVPREPSSAAAAAAAGDAAPARAVDVSPV